MSQLLFTKEEEVNTWWSVLICNKNVWLPVLHVTTIIIVIKPSCSARTNKLVAPLHAVYAIFSHMPWRSLRFQLYVFQESISVHPNIIVTLSSKFPFLSGLRQNEKQTMSSLLSRCCKGKVKPKQRFEWNVKLHEVKFIQKLTSREFSFWWLHALLQGLNFVLPGQR